MDYITIEDFEPEDTEMASPQDELEVNIEHSYTAQAVLRHRNTLSPIGKLFLGPLHDILPRIIEFDLADPESWDEYFDKREHWCWTDEGRRAKRLLELSHVSSHFREAILSARNLWQAVTISYFELSPDVVPHWLEHSGDALLDVTIVDIVEEKTYKSFVYRDFSSRTRTLVVTSHQRTLEELIHEEGPPLPELTRADISTRIFEHPDGPLVLDLYLSPTCEKLRSLTLTDVALHIPQSAEYILSRLDYLSLDRSSVRLVHMEGDPGTLSRHRDPDLETLKRMTRLRSMSLIDYTLPSGTDVEAPVQIKRLQKLHFHLQSDAREGFVNAFFTMVRVPWLESLKLSGGLPSWGESGHIVGPIPRVFIPCETLEVEGLTFRDDNALWAFLGRFNALESLSLIDVKVTEPFVRSLTPTSLRGTTVCPALEELIIVPRRAQSFTLYYEPITRDELLEILREWQAGKLRAALRSVKYASMPENGLGDGATPRAVELLNNTE